MATLANVIDLLESADLPPQDPPGPAALLALHTLAAAVAAVAHEIPESVQEIPDDLFAQIESVVDSPATARDTIESLLTQMMSDAQPGADDVQPPDDGGRCTREGSWLTGNFCWPTPKCLTQTLGTQGDYLKIGWCFEQPSENCKCEVNLLHLAWVILILALAAWACAPSLIGPIKVILARLTPAIA